MPYHIIRADITNLPFRVDAIVNTAHTYPKHGDGTDSAIFKKAGPQLVVARKKLGVIQEGEAAITDAFGLNADYIIHTVAPVWKDGHYGERDILQQCYKSVLKQVDAHHAKLINSIAIPLIGSGNLRFPKVEALRIAVNCIMDFCFGHENVDVYLVLFDSESYECGKKLCGNIVAYIDDAYIESKLREEYTQDDGSVRSRENVQKDIYKSRRERDKREDIITDVFRDPPSSKFSDILQSIMNKLESEEVDDPTITMEYLHKNGYITKQYFTKIRDGKTTKPGKKYVVSIALGLRLNLAHTQKLMSYANHHLDEKDPWDKVIISFISAGKYDIREINDRLDELNYTELLGC